MDFKKYDIVKHRHHEACWAAARSAQRGLQGFTVELGCEIIDLLNLKRFLKNPDIIPTTASELDKRHDKWRKEARDAARKHFQVKLTDGRAAKLINSYFKSALVCGDYHNHPKVSQLHPPIDRILLENLANDKRTKDRFNWVAENWTDFNSERYNAAIKNLRKLLPSDTPFWKIEKFWTVHRA